MESTKTDKNATVATERPLQTVGWSEKTPQWFRNNVDHYISKANFNFGNQPQNRKDLRVLYEVYNNQFPLNWFSHITDPLSAKKEQHKKFPAKIRPVTILRTNIDLLLGEYPKRPFSYNVSNLGESGYSRYMESMRMTAQSTLTDHFIQAALQEAQAAGQELTPEQIAQLEKEPPIPEQVQAEFKSSYKDNIAIKGQKYLKRLLADEEVRKKFHRMFKDWLIAGEAYSYKAIENGKVVYRKISPLQIDYDKSSTEEYVEDGEWVVTQEWLTLSDVVDKFYETLKAEHLKDLEKNYRYGSATNFYNHLAGNLSDNDKKNKIPVYHVQWKGKKKIGFVTYMDMDTFQMETKQIDENDFVGPEETVEWRWVNEVYEGWRITDDIFCNMQACPVQRNEMHNLSKCKLSYNGRKYSDTHADNLSVLEIGIPFQIMYIILNYTLEKTIAKSKGKILLMDKKTIPSDGGWDEEKFFYYAEALGYGLIDRSKPGVDKTWNQYQVIDMTLFEQIKQLIEILDYIKQQWDDVIGISRQRKGQTIASDGQGVNERAVFQSTVITDMIFMGFEELTQRELQGLMDLGRFATAQGVNKLYQDDDMTTTLMEIAPEDFMHEDLGVFVIDAAEELRKLNDMKGYAQAIIQNGGKASTVLEIIDSINVAELKQKLRQIEDIQAEIDRITAQDENEAQAAADEHKKQMLGYQSLLNREEMNEEYNRKEDIEMIKGTFNTFTFQDGDSNDNGIPDAGEVMKILQNQDKIVSDMKLRQEQNNQKTESLRQDRIQMEHDMKMDKENAKREDRKIKQGDKKLAIDKKKAAQRPKAATKK